MTAEAPTPAPLPEARFQLIVAQLGTQALVQLGEVPNPLTGEATVSVERARFTIDLLRILSDKTEGNLSPDEQQYFDETLTGLLQKLAAKQ